ncbi:MAG: hypothetical protein AAF351_02570 [Pseudomonadota bacterium]
MRLFRVVVGSLAMGLLSCTSEPPDFASESWLVASETCVADVIPVASVPIMSMESSCSENTDACWQACWSGHGESCYHLALEEQRQEVSDERSQALFRMACERGIDSGCTNYAAGIFDWAMDDEETHAEPLACANRAFEESCSRGDAWACTMFGLSLFRGIGRDVDYQRALEVVPGGCVHGPDDEACQGAKRIEAAARAAIEEQEDPQSMN